MSSVTAEPAPGAAQAALTGVARELGAVIDQPFVVLQARLSRANVGPVGASGVHVAFKFACRRGTEERRGALLVPLAEAITLASLLRGLPQDAVLAGRASGAPDEATKRALLQVATLVASALEEALRAHEPNGVCLRSLGCQGLRPGQPPAMEGESGRERLIAKAGARIGTFPPFELVLGLPLDGPAAS